MKRRTLLALAGSSALVRAAGAADSTVLAPLPPLRLDLSRPEDNLTAWMKMRGSLEGQDVYFWFTGGLDVAIPGEPIRPFVGVETLILRRTQRIGDGTFHVTDWEASFYRHPETGEVVDELPNPVTGKTVQPLHYREGPVTFEYTATRQPRLVGLETPFADKQAPFRQPWRVAGDTLWMTKAFYISGRPQWLDIKDFPEETPATPLTVSSIAVMESRLSQVLDPHLSSVPTSYSYQATSDWLPWMKLGQRPGYLVWHENGKKLFSLNELPADSLAALQRLHPVWFKRPVPWEGFTNLFFQYREQRGRR
jgi:Protein of unknown function (DUF1838)